MTPDDFLRLSEAGLTSKQIALVMEIMARDAKEAADKEEDRKAKGRERWHRWRNKHESNVSKREQTLANDSCAGDARGLDNLQTTEITGQKENKKDSAAAPRSDLSAFRSELSAILDHDRIEALVAVRRKKGATMTGNTGRLLVAAIRRCSQAPAEVADEMALRNWTSVKPEWLEPKSSPQRRANGPPRNDLDRMNAALDSLISGEPHEPDHPYTIDTSFERRDWRGPEGAVQRPAIPARN